MGMFDYVRVVDSLPDGNAHVQNNEFQTKDMDSLLETYTIRDRKLWIDRVRMEPIPEAELDDFAKRFHVTFRAVKDGEDQVKDYHGEFSFYTYVTEEKRGYEFKVRFTNGILDFIVRTQPCDGGEAHFRKWCDCATMGGI